MMVPGPEGQVESATMKRVTLRIVPFLMLCYFIAFVDRVNVGFAALQMTVVEKRPGFPPDTMFTHNRPDLIPRLRPTGHRLA